MEIFIHKGRITLEISLKAMEDLKLTLDLVVLHRQQSVTVLLAKAMGFGVSRFLWKNDFKPETQTMSLRLYD